MNWPIVVGGAMIDFTSLNRVALKDGLRPALPMQLCWVPGSNKPQPKYVSLTVAWISYGIGVPIIGTSMPLSRLGVAVTYNAKQGAQQLELVKSVFIDNANVNQPVYVLFPDTGFVITCPPNGQVLAPAHTGGASIEVIITGPANNTTLNDAPAATNVFLFDAQLDGLVVEGRPPVFEQRLATPLRGSLTSTSQQNNGWYWPALGDIMTSVVFTSPWTAGQVLSSNIFSGNQQAPVFANNGGNGTYIITGLRFGFSFSSVVAASSRTLSWTISANYGGADFWAINAQMPVQNAANAIGRVLLMDFKDTQFRLPWHASTNGLTGFRLLNNVAVTEIGWLVQMEITYTYTEAPLGAPQG